MPRVTQLVVGGGTGSVSLTPGSLVWSREEEEDGNPGREQCCSTPARKKEQEGQHFAGSGAPEQAPHVCQGEGESWPASPTLQDPRKTLGQEHTAEEGEAEVNGSGKSLQHKGLDNGAARHFTRCWEDREHH